MAEEGLDLADVVAGFEQVGGKAMAEGVGRDAFADTGFSGGVTDEAVEDAAVGVPAKAAAAFIAAENDAGKDELPRQSVWA